MSYVIYPETWFFQKSGPDDIGIPSVVYAEAWFFHKLGTTPGVGQKDHIMVSYGSSESGDCIRVSHVIYPETWSF